jgi:tyrosyl-tRNA synthetase
VTSDFRPQSHFLTVLVERGFLHQCSDLAGLDQIAKSGPLVGYIGFDCTPSLTRIPRPDHAVALAATGGKPIALMGNGTTSRRSVRQDASANLPAKGVAANKGSNASSPGS